MFTDKITRELHNTTYTSLNKQSTHKQMFAKLNRFIKDNIQGRRSHRIIEADIKKLGVWGRQRGPGAEPL